jgi:hypothetical protein
MAGTGYLTKQLVDNFENVVAIEACEAMRSATETPAIQPIRDADDIPSMLRNLSVRHAVSLASFHHLIKPTSQASVNWQARIIRDSFAEAPSLKSFLVVDVEAPTGLLGPSDLSTWPWEAPTEYEPYKAFQLNRGDASEYVQLLNQQYSGLPSRSAAWFREVVDPHSVVGHQDAFLGQAFANHVEGVSSLKLSAQSFPTPWFFGSECELDEFVWNKFAFRTGVDTEMIKRKTRDYLGVQVDHANVALGWRLGFWLITRQR